MPAQAAVTQPPDPAEATPRSRRPSSRVGKRKVLLSGIDTHARSYLEYRDVVADLADHLGTPSVVQLAIVEEAAGLIVWCRKARLALLKGEEFNVGTYTTATNALRRLLADIGQEALLRDVTPPSLAELADTIEREEGEPEVVTPQLDDSVTEKGTPGVSLSVELEKQREGAS